jgi:hypothetical protein
MSWEEDLEIVVKRTGAENLRVMCSEAYFDHKRAREKISLMASQPEPVPGSFPPIMIQAGNAVAAAGRVIGAVVTGQPVLVPPEVLEARRSECETCENLLNGRCKLCGCPYEKKIRLATEECPMVPPKWHRVAT